MSEKKLRRLLWLNHGHWKYLYGDDGELQCNKCMLDFKRDSVEKIENRFNEIALQQYNKAFALGGNMGTRYYIEVICPKCKFKGENVYYAPTCGFVNWNCPNCHHKVNLEKYTGITYEDASNSDLIKNTCNDIINIPKSAFDRFIIRVFMSDALESFNWCNCGEDQDPNTAPYNDICVACGKKIK